MKREARKTGNEKDIEALLRNFREILAFLAVEADEAIDFATAGAYPLPERNKHTLSGNFVVPTVAAINVAS